jgi:hypothetical protein
MIVGLAAGARNKSVLIAFRKTKKSLDLALFG